jgi:hypothetical protein
VLSKEDLNDVIKDYPDAQQLLKKKARSEKMDGNAVDGIIHFVIGKSCAKTRAPPVRRRHAKT